MKLSLGPLTLFVGKDYPYNHKWYEKYKVCILYNNTGYVWQGWTKTLYWQFQKDIVVTTPGYPPHVSKFIDGEIIFTIEDKNGS
jgi:hypothetical protein